MKTLVSTEWLDKNLENVRIFDASWHLPETDRNANKEYDEHHIKNSVFFDIDKNSNLDSSLPHMLPKKDDWEKILSKLSQAYSKRPSLNENPNDISDHFDFMFK